MVAACTVLRIRSETTLYLLTPVNVHVLTLKSKYPALFQMYYHQASLSVKRARPED